MGGWSTTPSEVARVLDDGTTQRTLTTGNEGAQVTSRTDPLGRTTTYAYAANGIATATTPPPTSRRRSPTRPARRRG